ncbi:MAG: inositol monophosphatase family protein [Candidatus Bathyarchaeota archaeon]
MTADWRSILHELSDNIQNKVLTVIPRRGNLPNIKFKDLLDKQAQDAIVETLKEHEVSAKLVSEEGDVVFGDGEYIITADPVDGTTNFSRGLKPAATSLSISETGTQSGVIAGIVANLYTGETYYAERGRGATLDGQPIRVAAPEKYSRALISIDISKGPRLDRTRRLLEMSRHLRSEGCTAMSLCHVASGTMDAHIDLRGIVRATDVSAGLLILEEAGGVYMVDGMLRGDFPLTRDTHMELVAADSMELLDEINSLMGRP